MGGTAGTSTCTQMQNLIHWTCVFAISWFLFSEFWDNILLPLDKFSSKPVEGPFTVMFNDQPHHIKLCENGKWTSECVLETLVWLPPAKTFVFPEIERGIGRGKFSILKIFILAEMVDQKTLSFGTFV